MLRLSHGRWIMGLRGVILKRLIKYFRHSSRISVGERSILLPAMMGGRMLVYSLGRTSCRRSLEFFLPSSFIISRYDLLLALLDVFNSLLNSFSILLYLFLRFFLHWVASSEVRTIGAWGISSCKKGGITKNCIKAFTALLVTLTSRIRLKDLSALLIQVVIEVLWIMTWDPWRRINDGIEVQKDRVMIGPGVGGYVDPDSGAQLRTVGENVVDSGFDWTFKERGETGRGA